MAINDEGAARANTLSRVVLRCMVDVKLYRDELERDLDTLRRLSEHDPATGSLNTAALAALLSSTTLTKALLQFLITLASEAG